MRLAGMLPRSKLWKYLQRPTLHCIYGWWKTQKMHVLCTYLDVIAADISSGLRWPLNWDISIARPTLVFPIDIRIIQHNGRETADKVEGIGVTGITQEIMMKGEWGLVLRTTDLWGAWFRRNLPSESIVGIRVGTSNTRMPSASHFWYSPVDLHLALVFPFDSIRSGEDKS